METSVVVCTNLWGKELHRQMGMGDIREPMWCNGTTLAQNARDVGSIPVLATIFSIFITLTTLIAMTMILYKLRAVWSHP